MNEAGVNDLLLWDYGFRRRLITEAAYFDVLTPLTIRNYVQDGHWEGECATGCGCKKRTVKPIDADAMHWCRRCEAYCLFHWSRI